MRQSFYILLLAGIVVIVVIALPGAKTTRMNSFMRDAMFPLTDPLARIVGFGRSLFQNEPQPENSIDLWAELSLLRLQLQQAQALEQENRVLRKMLGISSRNGMRLIAVEIMTRDVNAWWQTARLNKGTEDGITLDMPVITPEGLAGRIVRCSARTSDLLFLVDPACRVSARLPRLDTFGIVRGQGISWRGQASCRMDFISKTASVLPGDEVVTSGMGGTYPPGLLIGLVSQVHLDRSGLYQSADIVPSSNFRSIQLIFAVNRVPTATSLETESE